MIAERPVRDPGWGPVRDTETLLGIIKDGWLSDDLEDREQASQLAESLIKEERSRIRQAILDEMDELAFATFSIDVPSAGDERARQMEAASEAICGLQGLSHSDDPETRARAGEVFRDRCEKCGARYAGGLCPDCFPAQEFFDAPRKPGAPPILAHEVGAVGALRVFDGVALAGSAGVVAPGSRTATGDVAQATHVVGEARVREQARSAGHMSAPETPLPSAGELQPPSRGLLGWLSDAVTDAVTFVEETAEKGANLAGELLEDAVNTISETAAAIWSGVKKTASDATDVVVTAAQDGAKAVVGVAEVYIRNQVDSARFIWNTLAEIPGTIASGEAFDSLQGAIDAVVEKITGIDIPEDPVFGHRVAYRLGRGSAVAKVIAFALALLLWTVCCELFFCGIGLAASGLVGGAGFLPRIPWIGPTLARFLSPLLGWIARLLVPLGPEGAFLLERFMRSVGYLARAFSQGLGPFLGELGMQGGIWGPILFPRIIWILKFLWKQLRGIRGMIILGTAGALGAGRDAAAGGAEQSHADDRTCGTPLFPLPVPHRSVTMAPRRAHWGEFSRIATTVSSWVPLWLNPRRSSR